MPKVKQVRAAGRSKKHGDSKKNANRGGSKKEGSAAAVKIARRSFVPLDALSPYAEGGLMHVIIETPKGSPNKLAYDPALCAFKLSAVMPQGSTFPFDFGFLPGTLAADGDPLDILVLMDYPLSQGLNCLLSPDRRHQGRTDGKRWSVVENDRLIGISPETAMYENVARLSELPEEVVEQVQEFFVNYNAQRGKKFVPKGQKGPRSAKECFESARDRFKRKRRS